MLTTTGSTTGSIEPEHVRAFLDLTRLLDDVEKKHPDVSAALRLTLMRARRETGEGWLDVQRFRDVVDDLRLHGDLALTGAPVRGIR